LPIVSNWKARVLKRRLRFQAEDWDVGRYSEVLQAFIKNPSKLRKRVNLFACEGEAKQWQQHQ